MSKQAVFTMKLEGSVAQTLPPELLASGHE